MDNALETLFYPFTRGDVDYPAASARILFLNAGYHGALEHFKACDITLQQYFKPSAVALENKGFSVLRNPPEAADSYDYVFIKVPKNIIEATSLIARGLLALKTSGYIFCAGDNKAGGGRIANIYKAFGIKNIQAISKHKAKLCITIKSAVNQEALEKAIEAGHVQPLINGKFKTIPGIFGWKKIDKGSALLTEALTDDLSGKGADFGCGYGFISDYILAKNPNITDLSCIDADERAVRMARENLANYNQNIRFLWDDLTKDVHGVNTLDFIVMNPPFHEEARADISIGQSFIKTAAGALRSGGTLWMVANAHLPYEEILYKHFKTVRTPFEGQGFKVFKALK